MIKYFILVILCIIVFLSVINKIFKIDTIRGTILTLIKAFGFVLLGILLLYLQYFFLK